MPTQTKNKNSPDLSIASENIPSWEEVRSSVMDAAHMIESVVREQIQKQPVQTLVTAVAAGFILRQFLTKSLSRSLVLVAGSWAVDQFSKQITTTHKKGNAHASIT